MRQKLFWFGGTLVAVTAVAIAGVLALGYPLWLAAVVPSLIMFLTSGWYLRGEWAASLFGDVHGPANDIGRVYYGPDSTKKRD